MTSTVHLTITVQGPQPNAELNPGDALTVRGVATGIGGAEPVAIEKVTVALAGASVEAVRTVVPHQPVPTVQFEAALTVPAAGGNQQLEVVAFAANQTQAGIEVPVIIEGAVTPPPPWATSQLAPAGAMPAAARVTAIAKPAGCEMWWIGTDGAVNGVWTEPGSPWASYQLAGPGAAAPGGGITAVSKGGDKMEVWWIGPDGSVQAAWHDGSWARYTLVGAGSAAAPGPISAAPKAGEAMEAHWIGPVSATLGGITAVSKGGDKMEVWWIGPDGSVQAAWHDGSWTRYALAAAGAAALTGGITAVFKGGDLMEVWWVGPDGSVQAAYHDGSWIPYTLAGAGSASPTCRITSAYGGSLVANIMRVWWAGAAGATYQAFFDREWSVSPIGAGADRSGATAGVLFNPDTPTAFWARPDGSLVDAHPPEITLSAAVSAGLKGTVWLTLREDGSTRWHGDVTNDGDLGYNFALSVYAPTGTTADIGAAHHGHVAGSLEPGSSNDTWDEEHNPNPALTRGLAAYRFSQLSLKLEDSIDLVDYLEAAISAIFEAFESIAIGSTFIPFGAVVLIGVEIGSLAFTGSLVPGAIIAGGAPWLLGPGGIFVRALVTASNSDGRQLTNEEYTWANDMVFRGALPPIDSFRITNYLGAENRPFTFPTFAGPTLVNVGDAIYSNIHVNNGADQGEPTIIHELTHVCQIAHSHDVVFTATALATQLKNELDNRLKHEHDPAYDYGAAGFDYTSLGIEAQAEVVEDWFLGHPAKTMSPDPRNHTCHPMDTQSPYYHYITDNLRVGHF